MIEYKNKQELINKINTTFANFYAEFESIKDTEYNVLKNGIDKTPHQMISYQIGWLKLLPKWDNQENLGQDVVTPHKDYKWNNLGGLYKMFYQDYKDYNKQMILSEFVICKDLFIKWVLDFSEEQLFTPGIKKWATTTANWPIWKWVHINSVAPFTNFRLKIKKWKKL